LGQNRLLPPGVFRVPIVVNDQKLGDIRDLEKALSLWDGDLVFLRGEDDAWFDRKLDTIASYMACHPIRLMVSNNVSSLTIPITTAHAGLARAKNYNALLQYRDRPEAVLDALGLRDPRLVGLDRIALKQSTADKRIALLSQSRRRRYIRNSSSPGCRLAGRPRAPSTTTIKCRELTRRSLNS
jgi:hypothetical protein